MSARLSDVEALLRGAGLSDEPAKYDSDIHGWRCRYPDIYGPCSCFAELVTILVARLAEAEQAAEQRGAERIAPLIRRAVNDPGSFVNRGPDAEGKPYGESLTRWQDRAIQAALVAQQARPLPTGGRPMSARLSDVERATLLVPCECGHTINDHGTWCWYDDEHYCQCQTSFETLLTDRVATILAARLAEAERAAQAEIKKAWETAALRRDEAREQYLRAEGAETSLIDLMAAVEALADELEDAEIADLRDYHARDLRALLTQQHDGGGSDV